MNKSTKPERIIYLSSTHWDREWYRSFQSFRFRLVEVIDEIIETLEGDPAFTQFTLDGQSVVIEDYLEIKPQNRGRLEKLIQSGRIIAGPWYAMPDEALCSGESLVSNLALGFEVVRGMGVEPMKLGYICDIFGHVAQMPQIFAGFGIDAALLGRGTNRSETEAFFVWQSPDGSRCTTFKLPEEGGYGTFFFQVIEPYKSGRDPSKENLLARAVAYVHSELARSPLPYVILADGMDHENIHPVAVWLAQELGKEFGCEVEITSPASLMPDVTARIAQLDVMEGELRRTGKDMVEHSKLIPFTLSSRYDIKLANDRCQNLLERSAAPLAAMCAARGMAFPEGYFSVARRLMAQNQAHDSICGCSIDEVSHDMHYRYRQVATIAREIAEHALWRLCDAQDHQEASAEEAAPAYFGDIGIDGRVSRSPSLKLTILNSEPVDFSGVTTAYIDFPEDYAARYGEFLSYEPGNMFRIWDTDGSEVAYQLLAVEKGLFVNRMGDNYRGRRDRYHVALHADVPAMGFAELAVLPSAKPVRNVGSLRTSDLCAENEHLRMTVQPDGTLELVQKATGRVFGNLLRFGDDADCGDGWFHMQMPGAFRVFGDGSDAGVRLLEDGSERCTFEITRRMRVPAGLDIGATRTQRSADETVLDIRSSVTLARGAKMVQVRTTVKNTAENHRLRLLLETGVCSDDYQTDQPFAIVSRKTGAPAHTADWKEIDRGDSGFSHMIMCRDAQGGLAFISKAGMHECFARDDERGTVEITLLRSFGNTFLTNGEPEGQIPGEWQFDYALLPLSPEDGVGCVMRAVNRVRGDLHMYTSATAKAYAPVKSASALTLTSDNIAASMIAPASDGFTCVRLVNYGAEKATATLALDGAIADAYTANLLAEPQHPLSVDGNCVHVELGAHAVGTYLLK